MKLVEVHPDTPSLADLRRAYERLRADTRPGFGRMTATEMLVHCREFNRLCLGEIRPNVFIRLLARLLGPVFLRKYLAKSVTETPRNLGTLPALRVRPEDATDFDEAREALLVSLNAIEDCAARHRHPLYGELTKAEILGLVRHHGGHHAHQFGILEKARD